MRAARVALVGTGVIGSRIAPMLIESDPDLDLLVIDSTRDRASALARSLQPARVAIDASVRKTNRIVSLEEGWPVAGIGAEIAALMMEHAFDWLDAPVVRVCGADVPMPYAANLEKLALPQIEHVVAAARSVCYRA